MTVKRPILILTLTLIVCLLLPLWAVASPESPRFKPDEVLVKFKPGAAGKKIAGSQGLTIKKTIPKVDVHCFRLPSGQTISAALERLRKNPNVEWATPNHIVKINAMPNDTWFSYFQWGLYNPPDRCDVHAPEAWNLHTGSASTVIAIVDTGMDSTHPDLAGRVLTGYNAIDGSTDTFDDHMHGTFVGSLAAANTNNDEGIAGMDWHARLLPVKVIGGDGSGDEADAAEGIIWAADNGAHIINMSFGAYAEPGNEQGLLALEAACDYAWAAGCVLVAAAGNDALDDAVKEHYPSYYPTTLSVGGTDDYDEPWLEYDPWTGETYGTNYGDTLDVMAPSYFILGAVPMWYYYDVGTLLGDAYEFASGTSAAAPVVSGLAGLILAANPSWTNVQIVEQIKQTCDDLDASGWDRYTGWGRVNAFRALDEAYTDYASISDLHPVATGVRVRLSGKPVSAGTDDLGDRFYIQEPDRSSGIMVYCGSQPQTPTAQGQTVSVVGTLALVDGQYAIIEPGVQQVGSASALKPLGMTNKTVGGALTTYGGATNGAGLMNTGLLVRTWGTVTASGWNYFYVDDGSNLRDGSGFRGLKVFTGSVSPASEGKIVLVTGISVCEVPSGTQIKIPVVRVRSSADITIRN